MKYSIILLFGLLGCTSKHDERLLVGDLYFDDFRFGNFYNLADSIRERVEHNIDTTNLETADSSSRSFITLFNKFKKEGLLYKPFVDVKIKEDSIVKLYLDSVDYDRLKLHKRKTLQQDGKKVIISAMTRTVGNYGVVLLYCTDLLDVSLVDGETLLGRSKFRIEDYE